MSKGGPSGTTTSTQNTAPWGPQQPYLTDIFSSANSLYRNNTPQYYPGDTYAAPNDMQHTGVWSINNTAANDLLPGAVTSQNGLIGGGAYLGANPSGGLFNSVAYGSGAANPAQQYYTNLAQNGTTNPALSMFGSLAGAGNPISSNLGDYLSGSNLRAGNPNTSALTSSILASVIPSIQSQFIQGGSLSSPEAARATAAGATSALAAPLFQQYQQEEQNQIAAANALASSRLSAASGVSGAAQNDLANQIAGIGGLSSTAANTVAQQLQAGTGLSGNWESGVGDVLKGVALAPQTDALQYQPGQEMLTAGGAEQQFEQQGINDAVARWNWGQQLPFNALNQYIGAVTGNYGGTTNLNQPYFQPSTMSQIGQGVGMAGAGISAASQIPSAISGLGALMALLPSDRRLKDNIRAVGELDNGLTVYSYRYKDDPEEMRRIGLMADEVEVEHPDAVYTMPADFGHLAGMKAVDYSRAVA